MSPNPTTNVLANTIAQKAAASVLPRHTYRPGDRVSFVSRSGDTITGTVSRVNRKTCTVEPDDTKGKAGLYYRVPPAMLSLLTVREPERASSPADPFADDDVRAALGRCSEVHGPAAMRVVLWAIATARGQDAGPFPAQDAAEAARVAENAAAPR